MAKAQNNNIVIGHIDSLFSKSLSENRTIWVHVPDSDQNGVHAKRHYPVVYLLDGTSHFSSVVGMIDQHSSVNGNTIFPQMIVVGIVNTNQLRDLTPTPGGAMMLSAADSTRRRNSGEGRHLPHSLNAN